MLTCCEMLTFCSKWTTILSSSIPAVYKAFWIPYDTFLVVYFCEDTNVINNGKAAAFQHLDRALLLEPVLMEDDVRTPHKAKWPGIGRLCRDAQTGLESHHEFVANPQ